MLPEHAPIFSYTHQLRSRYAETDKMGYVYYGRYLEYFEVARTEMIRAAGISYRELEEKGFMLPVVDVQLNYREPVYYDELMDIRVMVHEKPSVRLHTWYEVTTQNGSKINTSGKVTLVFISAETRRPVRCPDFFLDGLSKLMIL